MRQFVSLFITSTEIAINFVPSINIMYGTHRKPHKLPSYLTYILVPLFFIGFFYTTWNGYRSKSQESLILSGPLKYCEPLDYRIRECDCVKRMCRGRYYSDDEMAGSKEMVSSQQSCDEATIFGPHQKVVSYTLYGEKRHPSTGFPFLKGVLMNLMQMREVYPGWVMRLYSDIQLEDDPDLCEITCSNPDFFYCNVRSLPSLGDVTNSLGTFWRFIPVGDFTVDIFISRDVDSLLSPRERLSTREWEESNKTFHFIRDHPQHNSPILAGLWGAKVSLINELDRADIQSTLLQEGEKLTNNALGDQEALKKVLYQPKYFNVSLAHDSYHCENFIKTECRPYPGEKSGTSFVGDRLENLENL